MPIIKTKGLVIYFSHIPKCAGSSVETFLDNFCDAVVFLDRKFLSNKNRWSLSSPQHIDGYSLKKIFNSRNFFDFYFAVVRDPISRFKSAFVFQKYIRKKIPGDLSINKFISLIIDKKILLYGYCDNHFLPMVDFLMPNARYKIFKLENGVTSLKKWFEETIYKDKIKFEILHENSTNNKIKEIENLRLTIKSLESLKIIYKKDFEAFKY